MLSSCTDTAPPAADLLTAELHRRQRASSDAQLASSLPPGAAALGAPATPSLRFGHGDRPQPCAPPSPPCPPPAPDPGPPRPAAGRAGVAPLADAWRLPSRGHRDILAEVVEDFSAYSTISRATQRDAVAKTIAYLDQHSPPLRPPWVLAQMDAGLLVSANWLRQHMMQRQHTRLALHLSDQGFLAHLCGRWHWRPSTGWTHQPWREQEAVAGGVAPAQPAGEQGQLRALGQRRHMPSLALQSLMATIDLHSPPQLADVRLNICHSSHQLAALIADQLLPAPVALLALNVEHEQASGPTSGNISGLAERDGLGPYVLTSRLFSDPEVSRPSPGQASADEEDDSVDQAQILGALAQGMSISRLAAMFDPQTAGQIRWLDLAALRAADLQLACADHVPLFVCRGGRGQRLNRQALAALCERQVGAALALAPPVPRRAGA